MYILEALLIFWIVIGAIISIPIGWIIYKVYNVKLKKSLIMALLIIESSIIVILASLHTYYQLFIK